MSFWGLAFYAVASLVELKGPATTRPAAMLLVIISPFATLEPLATLVHAKQYALGFDWLYLAAALAVAVASSHRERRSFYYAGLLNTAVAVGLLTERRHWFDAPWWAVAVICAGLAVLAVGLALDVRERRRRLG